jgi:hypothetical protein
MPGHQATTEAAKKRFWNRFIEQARENGVKETAIQWHVRRAEAYLKAFPDKRLSQHTHEDVTGYLEQAGRLDRIEAWQFVQIVDAIRNLLIIAKASVAKEIDWGFWRDSARTLEPNHPTIAREAPPVSTEANQDAPVLGARFKEKKSDAPSAFDSVREAHRALLERMVAEIRRRVSVQTLNLAHKQNGS